MKINIDIGSKVSEDIISIQAAEMTDEIRNVVKYIESMGSNSTLNGRIENDIYRIKLQHVHRFFIEDKVLQVQTSKNTYAVDKRLYQIEEITGLEFIKISKSEIININFLDHLSITPSGQIKIYMKNGEYTFSSRRYLKSIKERLSL